MTNERKPIAPVGLTFQVVPNAWRDKVTPHYHSKRTSDDSSDPLKMALLSGKTILINNCVPDEAYAFRRAIPYRSLYAWARFRGRVLHCYFYDDIDKQIARAILMWLD